MTRGQGRAPSQRQLRVGEELRHALAQVLERHDMRDPVLRDTPVTVTEVRASPDLRHAVAFVVPLGGGDSGPVLAALERAAPWLRGQVARLVRLKYAPTLSFQPDVSFDEARRVEDLLRGLHGAAGDAGEEDAGAGGT